MATELIMASARDDLVRVQELIRDGANVNEVSNGVNAMTIAAKFGYIQIVRELLEHGANVNAANDDGITALMEASLINKLIIVQYLIDHGANVNQRDNAGRTALIFACAKSFPSMIKYLISAGADVNAHDTVGNTALHILCRMNQHVHKLELLLENGANVNAADNGGRTALMEASLKNNLLSVRCLISYGANINARDSNGDTAKVILNRMHSEIIHALDMPAPLIGGPVPPPKSPHVPTGPLGNVDAIGGYNKLQKYQNKLLQKGGSLRLTLG
jgi:ankyrin repeat protein